MTYRMQTDDGTMDIDMTRGASFSPLIEAPDGMITVVDRAKLTSFSLEPDGSSHLDFVIESWHFEPKETPDE